MAFSETVVEQDCPYQNPDGEDRYSTHVYMEKSGRTLAYPREIASGVKYPAASNGRGLTMKEARGKGLTRPLMFEAVRISKSLSPVIGIEAQAYLRDFYKSLGFVETSDEFLLDGIPHIGIRLE